MGSGVGSGVVPTANGSHLFPNPPVKITVPKVKPKRVKNPKNTTQIVSSGVSSGVYVDGSGAKSSGLKSSGLKSSGLSSGVVISTTFNANLNNANSVHSVDTTPINTAGSQSVTSSSSRKIKIQRKRAKQISDSISQGMLDPVVNGSGLGSGVGSGLSSGVNGSGLSSGLSSGVEVPPSPITNKDVFLSQGIEPVRVVHDNSSTYTKQGSISIHSGNTVPTLKHISGLDVEQTLTLSDVVLDHSDPNILSITPMDPTGPPALASLLAFTQGLPGQEEDMQLDYNQYDDGDSYLLDNPLHMEEAVSLLGSTEDDFQEDEVPSEEEEYASDDEEPEDSEDPEIEEVIPVTQPQMSSIRPPPGLVRPPITDNISFTGLVFDMDPQVFMDLPEVALRMVAQAWWNIHPNYSNKPLVLGYPVDMLTAVDPSLQTGLITAFTHVGWETSDKPLHVAGTSQPRADEPIIQAPSGPRDPPVLVDVRPKTTPRGFTVKCRNHTGGCTNVITTQSAHTRCKQCLGIMHIPEECVQCLSMSKTARHRATKFFREWRNKSVMPSISQHGDVLPSNTSAVSTPASISAPPPVQPLVAQQQPYFPEEDEDQSLSQAERLTLGYMGDLDATYVSAFQQTVLNAGLMLGQTFITDTAEPPQKRASLKVPRTPKVSLQVPLPQETRDNIESLLTGEMKALTLDKESVILPWKSLLNLYRVEPEDYKRYCNLGSVSEEASSLLRAYSQGRNLNRNPPQNDSASILHKHSQMVCRIGAYQEVFAQALNIGCQMAKTALDAVVTEALKTHNLNLKALDATSRSLEDLSNMAIAMGDSAMDILNLSSAGVARGIRLRRKSVLPNLNAQATALLVRQPTSSDCLMGDNFVEAHSKLSSSTVQAAAAAKALFRSDYRGKRKLGQAPFRRRQVQNLPATQTQSYQPQPFRGNRGRGFNQGQQRANPNVQGRGRGRARGQPIDNYVAPGKSFRRGRGQNNQNQNQNQNQNEYYQPNNKRLGRGRGKFNYN